MSNMVVNTNVAALNAHRNSRNVSEIQSKASFRLSSGLRVNTAADDAAGLAISEKMRSQIRGLNMASRNGQDAISLVQTAEGGMASVNEMLIRVRELVVYAANDVLDQRTITDEMGDRAKIQSEINEIMDEIDNVAQRLEFNKKRVISGDYAHPNTIHFQIGANALQNMEISIASVDVEAIGLRTPPLTPPLTHDVDVMQTDGAIISALITNVDDALMHVTNERAALGAVQNRLEYTIKSLDISAENLSASESRIRDADMAKEMMDLTRGNILQQASVSMLAQSGQRPEMVLQLLR